MNKWSPEANEIFADLAIVADVAERRQLLDDKCGTNGPLRRAVESLLAAYDEDPTFLDEALVNAEMASTSHDTGKGIGSQIDAYKLLQKIGEGGFGVVYMADQKKPVRRKVALKVIKAGMDTREVIARFEVERQALAMMDHPNIAKVLDAGATDSGRPYFVMELVRGVAITEFCDKNRLGTRDRLAMFATVCQAVQHAHHKGIIHRDLKPSNVMVTLNDGLPLVKVIDFGVAKAINQELTERTLFTSYGQMVGTPQYMSPEQAEMSAMDIDTRSDVYSLGVLLYELLTGTTPLNLKELRAAGLLEIQKLITNEEAPRPSTRLSTLGDELSIIATNRQADPSGLQKLVHGELDWIVMTALDKDRNRRYETASAFAADIQRYLSDETVEACPPSVGYRVRKYLRRNRVALVTGAVILISLIGGLTGTSWMAVEANAQKEIAVQALGRVQDELRWRAMILALRGQVEEVDVLLRDIDISKLPNRGWGQRIRGIAALYSDDPATAVAHLKEAIERGDETVAAYALISRAYINIGSNPIAKHYERMLASMVPRTTEDELFLASILYVREPQRSFEMANRAVKKYPSPTALSIRANACEHMGIRTRDLTWFDQAIADSYSARSFTSEEVPTLALWHHTWALEIARSQGDALNSQYHALAAHRLLARPGFTSGATPFFYEVTGEIEKAAATFATSKTDKGRRTYAFFLMAQCDDEAARQVIAEMESPDDWPTVDQCRAAIMAESPENHPCVKEILLKRVAAPNLDPHHDVVEWLGLLHQYGFPEDGKRESLRVAAELRAADKPVPPAVEFFAYKIDDKQLQESVGDDYRLRADAYLQVIQRYLGLGKKAEAREKIEQWNSMFSDVFYPYRHLTRMRNLSSSDPAWPHWIGQQRSRSDR